jgi:hypothetical protein
VCREERERRHKRIAFEPDTNEFGGVNEVGKILVVAGLVIAAIGVVLWPGFGRGWLGRLPGDINYSKDNFSFHFPIVTCLLVSVILTLVMWLFRR